MNEGVKRFLLSGWPAALVLAALLVGFGHQGTLLAPAVDSQDELATIADVRDKIVDHWVEDPGPRRDRLRYGAVEGMASQLDPYSSFIPPERRQKFDEELQGEFGGLGVLIEIDKGQVVIVTPVEDTPAWAAGLLPDDRVLEIDGKKYEFNSREEAQKHLRGKVGSTVTLLVSNPRREKDVLLTLKRGSIKSQSVRGTRIVDPELPPQELVASSEPRIGYMDVTAFQEPTNELVEFDKAIAELTSWSYTGLVLDLRGNPGGLVRTAMGIASRFLEKGDIIFSTRGRNGTNEQKTAAEPPENGPKVRCPVAILVDQDSASASEILAGALRDHGLACLVGTRSLGKGSVQTLFEIDGGKAKLKLTTQYWYTPGGRRIHRSEKATEKDPWGLLPDVPATIDANTRAECLRQENDWETDALRRRRDPGARPYERGTKRVRDPQLDAAVAHLRRVLKKEIALIPATIQANGNGGGTAPVGSGETVAPQGTAGPQMPK